MAGAQRPTVLLALDREDGPLAGNAFEYPLAAVLELDAGPGHEQRHRTRGENLAGTAVFHHTRGDVDTDAADVVTPSLDLAGLNASSDLDGESLKASRSDACARRWGAARTWGRGARARAR